MWEANRRDYFRDHLAPRGNCFKLIYFQCYLSSFVFTLLEAGAVDDYEEDGYEEPADAEEGYDENHHPGDQAADTHFF